MCELVYLHLTHSHVVESPKWTLPSEPVRRHDLQGGFLGFVPFLQFRDLLVDVIDDNEVGSYRVFVWSIFTAQAQRILHIRLGEEMYSTAHKPNTTSNSSADQLREKSEISTFGKVMRITNW
jgi:hypothetical protein